MHVYVISVVIYTTVLSQMHKSKSSSIQPQRSGHLKKEIEEDEEDEISDLEREPSPIDDSDADGDYVQPSEEEEASDVSDQDPQDDDLQSLLSNKSIPQKQRELMRRLLLERRVLHSSALRRVWSRPRSDVAYYYANYAYYA